MEVFQAISQRRSIRKFKEKEVPDSLIMKIIQAGIWAPSAGNLQSWEMILVKDPETRKKLSAAAYMRDFISKAPVVMVACINKSVCSMVYGARGVELYSIQDVSCALENMLLMAHARGLGACWVGAFDEQEVIDLLRIPSQLRPVALVPLGYPDEKPYPPPRRDVDDFLHFERY
ncbi:MULTISPECIES: nitroreductase family protein [Methanobacterium]|jgi:nitroreductase|uniref:Nitroreductase n=1 Tax=Methanobacterium formicicum TaxID=2162 RepID=A0A090I7Z3_METFO|nr:MULTISPECIES: nitroreductase family protein [Methanobacterium]AIS31175.1 nitroreductase family protein [Methanobacterium formicicum]KUK75697.1 MAG: Nitroreductase [Methanobacterium sp. 42_16]MBF4475519.1 nitroreductase family protein [Methanobacterium formicicum]MDG3548244.1 nitroreductase family protein [Methanobacterium formicicum]MDH2659908.1 nitroreductase family protein [Methanobacterium formicicum]